MDDASLAEQLRLLLKPARGFAPKLSHICAAILMARDAALSSREACRRVPGVPLGAHNRVTELASRIRGLLSAEQLSPPAAAAAAANAAVPAAPSSTAPSPLLNNPLQQRMAPDETMSWDLPPLEATRETPSNVPQQQQIEEPEPMDVEMEPVEMEPASTPHTLTAPASTPPAATPPSAPPQPASTPPALTPLATMPPASTPPTAMPPTAMLPAATTLTASTPSSRLHPVSTYVVSKEAVQNRIGPHHAESPVVGTHPFDSPFDQEAYEAFELPESARSDLDKDAYLHRESLRDPDLRRLVPSALRRRRRLPKQHASLAAAKGHDGGRSARHYIKNYGYLHGIGPEPEDLGDNESMFTPSNPGSKPQVWHHDESSECDSDHTEGELRTPHPRTRAVPMR